MNLEGLNLGLTLYGSWGALARAGYANEILKEYANYRIHLTHRDIQEMRTIFLCQFDDRWHQLLDRYKERKHGDNNEVHIKGADSINFVVLPALCELSGGVDCEVIGGDIV